MVLSQIYCPVMYQAEWNEESGWSGSLVPYGPISMMPSAQVLNYGQSIFEGMKAYRGDDGEVRLFRPRDNAARFAQGAGRMCMAEVPIDMFLRAVELVVQANAAEVPDPEKGSLYLRPLLIGSGSILGLAPSPTYTFLVYASPANSRAQGGRLPVMHLRVEESIHRAAPRGTGGTKAAGNYSAVLVAQQAAKRDGFSDVVYLDARTDSYIEEGSGYNLFLVKGRTLVTPPATGTILPGITRRSVVQLAERLGYAVEERAVKVEEALEADEMFATGTAVVVTAVGSLTHRDVRKQFGTGEPGPVAVQLYTLLTDIQYGRAPDELGWMQAVAGASGERGVVAGPAAAGGRANVGERGDQARVGLQAEGLAVKGKGSLAEAAARAGARVVELSCSAAPAAAASS